MTVYDAGLLGHQANEAMENVPDGLSQSNHQSNTTYSDQEHQELIFDQGLSVFASAIPADRLDGAPHGMSPPP
jgi:hypothetical protein